MVHTDAASQGMISIVSGTARVSSVVQKFTIPRGKFHKWKIAFFLSTCMHIPRKRVFSCMVVTTETVLSSPDTYPISFGRKYPDSIIINATLVCGWEGKGPLGLQSIRSLDSPTATPWNIPSVRPLRREFTSLWKITVISGKESPPPSGNTSVERIKHHLPKYSRNYGPIKISWKWAALRMAIPVRTVN